jgi:hypothetical protein
MMKCPFCQYDNEDGTLYCEQCKSDLGVAQTVERVPPAVVLAIPVDVPQEGKALPLAIPVTDIMPGDRPRASPSLEPPIPVGAIPQEPPPTVPMVCVPASVPPQEVPPLEAPPLDQTAIRDSTQVAPVPPADSAHVSQSAEPKLVVLRGLRINVEYPIYEGLNYIGRTEVQPVDIDLEDQEPPDRMFSSRQHACISYKDGTLIIEDLSSSNGTFVNRTRLDRGQKKTLKANDIIQIGAVQLKVKV